MIAGEDQCSPVSAFCVGANFVALARILCSATRMSELLRRQLRPTTNDLGFDYSAPQDAWHIQLGSEQQIIISAFASAEITPESFLAPFLADLPPPPHTIVVPFSAPNEHSAVADEAIAKTTTVASEGRARSRGLRSELHLVPSPLSRFSAALQVHGYESDATLTNLNLHTRQLSSWK